ncbi:MAG: DUF3530 family protein [Gammaproteobacteria bacterium]|nr:DUF3530 family protein [Gammaproteobacteria bacterium]
MKILDIFLISTLAWTAALATNLQREHRIADQLNTPANAGAILWLGDQSRPFLALHRLPASSETLGGAIILHDMNANPDSAEVIQPLRLSLAEQGWETLSIQLPLATQHADRAEYQALMREALPRIQAAVNFFLAKKNRNLVLIGHGLGARMGLTYLGETTTRELRAFVAIGMPGTDPGEKDPLLAILGELKIPMLDLFGSRDLDRVTGNTAARRSAAKRAGIAGYRQDRVSGADHDFQGLAEALQSRVGAWLKREAAGMEIGDGAY